MKKITIFLLGILLSLSSLCKADTGDVTTYPFVPETGKVYRIFSLGQYNGSTSLTSVRKYLYMNSSGTVGYTETLDATNYDMLWVVTAISDTAFTIKNFNQEKFMNSAGSSSPTLSTTSEEFRIKYSVTASSLAMFYFKTTLQKGLELGTTQYTVFFKSTYADRYRFKWCFQAVDKPVTTVPTIAMSTGSSAQTVYQTQSIKTTTYKWGGTATGAAINWTGTASATTAPDGITVSTDATAKTLTISGNLNTLGSYGYSITSTDGTLSSDPLTGTLNTKTTTKYKMAYITTVTSGAPATLDGSFVTAFSNDFDLTYINATETGIDYSVYDIVVESAIPGSSSAGLTELKTKCLNKPFVNMKSFQLQSSAWNWATPANTTTTTVVVPDAVKTHPIYSGITFSGTNSNEVAITTATSGNMLVNITAWTGTPSPSSPIALSTVKDATTSLGCYFEIPVGSTMNGMTTATSAKQVYLGLSEASWGSITTDAVTMALNAAKFVVMPPSLSLTSAAGTNSQIVSFGYNIAPVSYALGFSVKSATITWTDNNSNTITVPDGITATTDLVNNTITISGTPTSTGTYNYSITATDGSTVSSAQSGSITSSLFTATQNLTNRSEIISSENFDFTGRRISKDATGLMIQKVTFSDGSTILKKIYHAESQK